MNNTLRLKTVFPIWKLKNIRYPSLLTGLVRACHRLSVCRQTVTTNFDIPFAAASRFYSVYFQLFILLYCIRTFVSPVHYVCSDVDWYLLHTFCSTRGSNGQQMATGSGLFIHASCSFFFFFTLKSVSR